MKNVEDLYTLSPMQRLMLLHAVAATGRDVLFNQFRYDIIGELDVAAFEQAWQEIVAHHTILRTAFVWKDLDQPLQAVRRQVTLPFDVVDGRHDVEALLESDRAAGFTLSHAPLMRVKLVRDPDGSWQMIWSSHHLLLDRWCLPILLTQLLACYEAIRAGQPLPAIGRSRFRDYIEWIGRQDAGTARAFWQKSLEGLAAKPLPDGGSSAADARLEGVQSAAIRAFARSHRLTVGTVLQGAWALVLNRCTQSQDVVFGTATSGRPHDLPDVESMIGSFVNNLPVRVTLPSDAAVVDWLKDIQRHRETRAPVEYVAPDEIQQWCGTPPHRPLFDSLIVWLAGVGEPRSESLELRPVGGEVQTAIPVTLSVAEEGDDLHLRLQVASGPNANEMLELLRTLLDELASEAHATLAALSGFVQGKLPAATIATPWMPVGAGSAKSGRERCDLESQERLLLDEMRSVLGTVDLGLDDDFFRSGGDSLRAVSFHQRVVCLTGISVPLLSLFARATPRQMAKTLHEREWPLEGRTLRPLKPEGTRPPLFCIASPEVNTLGYMALARRLDRDQPVFVLQGPPASDSIQRTGPSEIGTVATEYAQALNAAQPDGAVRLLGMCGGSHIALEMARRLHAEGRAIEFVGIVNTWARYTLSWRWHARQFANRIRDYAQRYTQRLVPRRRDAGGAQEVSASVVAEPAVLKVEDEWIATDWPHCHDGRPKFPGKVTVFRIRPQQRFRIRDDGLGWGGHAEEVELQHLSGKVHLAILREPAVEEMAERLAECLGRISGS